MFGLDDKQIILYVSIWSCPCLLLFENILRLVPSNICLDLQIDRGRGGGIIKDCMDGLLTLLH